MVTVWSGSSQRQISPQEQHIYDHLLYWIERETPVQMIDRFQALFIEGTDYPDAAVCTALEQVTASPLAGIEFHYVLNRCCHILINRWQAARTEFAIPQLVKLFEAEPATVVRSRSLRRLRELVKQFRETEQYLTLRRLAQVVEAADMGDMKRPLGTLIRRYPYLYEHCLISEDCTQEQQHTVKGIQTQMQRQFEIDLSQYITYQVRRSQISSRLVLPSSPRSIYPVSNPTLLHEQELAHAVKHYVGKVQGTHSYRDLACNFLAQTGDEPLFRHFKDDLYDYITASIDREYGQRAFYNQLYSHLQTSLSDSNDQRLNDFLLVRTCSQLLNFLVVESPQSPQHFVYLDLITNLGATLTTGLLLKIVLLCRKVKPYLERRLSILFNHYETHSREAVQWLVLALEHANIALSTHFGAIDLSFIH
ncbi:hypothetical protein H6F67_02250 [Microcoleus sp. FACHB-1515]|uniref:hypothetical protein n=1 Tax=Cyanophyceae TaxID=3028117 RepID=UPI00168546EB|nr:hypothetical protein [Microcoleus sp. FACHB-1515]MBD2088682.1 hypothetical protein [Microcoleus sp. FACHB-1515]